MNCRNKLNKTNSTADQQSTCFG